MIFLTVGTHEQNLDRVLKQLDYLIETGIITEEVFAQSGYNTYQPKHFETKQMISYQEMDAYVQKARIVMTHGGPGSIFHALQYNKIPIVIPRNPAFNEHVDEHQILFARRLEAENKIIAVYDIETLGDKIKNYESLSNSIQYDNSSVDEFIDAFSKRVEELMK